MNKYLNFLANGYEDFKRDFDKHSYIEITDDKELIIDNCRRIIFYEESRLELELAAGTVTISGRRLILRSFRGEAPGVIIRGEIEDVRFGGKK